MNDRGSEAKRLAVAIDDRSGDWVKARRAELFAAIDQLTSQIDSLEARLEEAQRDSERLDWLEQQANRQGGLLLHDGAEHGRNGLGLRPGHLSRTLREAIDTAMAQDTTEGA